MKTKDIVVGHVYRMNVSGKSVPVEVLEQYETYQVFGKSNIRWRCRNMRTGRTIIVRSPQRFRNEIMRAGPGLPLSIAEGGEA